MVIFFDLPPIHVIEIASPPKISETKGTILWQDNFDGALRWDGGAKDNTAGKVYSGDNCFKVTTAGAAPWSTQVTASIASKPKVFESKIGYEVFFYPTKISNTQIASIEFIIFLIDGTNQYSAKVKFLTTSATEGKWQYSDSAGAYQDITGGAIPLTANAWHRIKLIIDGASKKYVSLEFGDTKFDLSAYSLQSAAVAQNRILVRLKLTGINATTTDVYFDDIIVTYNEP